MGFGEGNCTLVAQEKYANITFSETNIDSTGIVQPAGIKSTDHGTGHPGVGFQPDDSRLLLVVETRPGKTAGHADM